MRTFFLVFTEKLENMTLDTESILKSRYVWFPYVDTPVRGTNPARGRHDYHFNEGGLVKVRDRSTPCLLAPRRGGSPPHVTLRNPRDADVEIMYDAAFDDMKLLEDELMRIGTHYIAKSASLSPLCVALRGTHSP